VSNELLVFIVIGGIIALRWFCEFLMLAINYYWYWKEYRCRLEPWTHEWQRRVKKWWPILMTDAVLFAALALDLLLFSPFVLPFWAKIAIIATGAVVVAFYSWLLLHLGGFAVKIWRWFRARFGGDHGTKIR
jgi:hypothetical protein